MYSKTMIFCKISWKYTDRMQKLEYFTNQINTL